MGMRKLLLRGAVVALSSALPLWITASPASAFESHSRSDIVDHTFTDSAGDDVTCTVEYDASLFRETAADPFQAEAATQVFTGFVDGVPDPERCRALVGVEIGYHDRSVASSTPGRSAWSWPICNSTRRPATSWRRIRCSSSTAQRTARPAPRRAPSKTGC